MQSLSLRINKKNPAARPARPQSDVTPYPMDPPLYLLDDLAARRLSELLAEPRRERHDDRRAPGAARGDRPARCR